MSNVVISAVKFEVEPLLAAFAERGIDSSYVEAGIGALSAARASRELGQACRGKDVIYVGTCGTLGEFDGPELVRIKRALWLTPCERAGIAWAIDDLDKPVVLPEPPAWASELPTRIAVCSPTIAKSSVVRPEAAERAGGVDPKELVENLELYSCAADIVASAKTFVAIFGVTNAVSPDGRKQWREHFKTAAKMTAGYIAERAMR